MITTILISIIIICSFHFIKTQWFSNGRTTNKKITKKSQELIREIDQNKTCLSNQETEKMQRELYNYFIEINL
jgi:Txe/YoeB family toxin of Txe-Axe toxin-antitoxin module